MIGVQTTFANVIVCTLCAHCDRHAHIHTHYIAQALQAREKKASNRRAQGVNDPSVEAAIDAINAAADIPTGGGADTDATLMEDLFGEDSRPANTQAAVAAVSTQVLTWCVKSSACHPCM